MKKALFFLVAVCLPMFLLAQDDAIPTIVKGNKFLTGNAQLNYTGESALRSNRSANLQTGISLKMAKFVNNHIAIGGHLGHNFSLTRPFITPNDKFTEFIMSFGPLMRYYKGIGGERVYFFTEAQLMGLVSSAKLKSHTDKSSWMTYGGGLSARPGFAYFLTPKIGLELSYGNLYYTANKVEYSRIITHVADFNLSLSSLQLGVNWFL